MDGPLVAPHYKIKMKPRFMMTTLIIRSQAKCFPRDGEGTTFVHFPKALRTRWFEKSTYVCPVDRDGSGSPQRWGARWRRQSTIRKSFINSTETVSAATTPRCSVEITCNHVNFLRYHNGTKSLDELHGVNVADMQRQNNKELLTTDCGTTKGGT